MPFMVIVNWLIKSDPETGTPTDGFKPEHHIWHVDKVKALVANQDEAVTFFCGGSRNFPKFIDLFDDVFVLEVDLETSLRRIDERVALDPIRNGNKKNTIEITYAIYKGGTVPNSTGKDLIELSKNVVVNERFLSFFQESGSCGFGKYGTVAYTAPSIPRFQVWHISNGKDFIFLTHECLESPTEEEIDEVRQIVAMLSLNIVERPWWKFWVIP